MTADDVLAHLLTFPNVLVTSHQAIFTQETLTAIAETTLRNLPISKPPQVHTPKSPATW